MGLWTAGKAPTVTGRAQRGGTVLPRLHSGWLSSGHREPMTPRPEPQGQWGQEGERVWQPPGRRGRTPRDGRPPAKQALQRLPRPDCGMPAVCTRHWWEAQAGPGEGRAPWAGHTRLQWGGQSPFLPLLLEPGPHPDAPPTACREMLGPPGPKRAPVWRNTSSLNQTKCKPHVTFEICGPEASCQRVQA